MGIWLTHSRATRPFLLSVELSIARARLRLRLLRFFATLSRRDDELATAADSTRPRSLYLSSFLTDAELSFLPSPDMSNCPCG